MRRLEPYNYVRYTWLKTHDIMALIPKLKERFTVIDLPRPDRHWDLALNPRDRPQIEVKADTLSAYLAPAKAILFQKESAPFTRLDMELREAVLTMYPHRVATPISLYYRKEPELQQEME